MFAEVFDHLGKLSTYSVNRAPKMSDLKRALRLAGMLVSTGIDTDADERVRGIFTAKLRELRDEYASESSEWEKLVKEGGEIEVDIASVAIGDMTVSGRRNVRMVMSGENIDKLFDAAGRKLAAGEGLHRSYWKRYHDRERPNETKLEFFAIVSEDQTSGVMEKLARIEFEKLWEANKPKIKLLSASDRARFQKLVQASGNPCQRFGLLAGRRGIWPDLTLLTRWARIALVALLTPWPSIALWPR